MKIPEWANKVTTLSKILAMGLFVALPFMGFKVGSNYQRKLDYPIYRNIEKEKIVDKCPKEIPQDLIARCGDFPKEMKYTEAKFDVVSGPEWSSDCRHTAWGKWRTGPGYRDDKSADLGLFVYDFKTDKIKRVYKPNPGEDITFKRWVDAQNIEFNISGQSGPKVMNIETGQIVGEE